MRASTLAALILALTFSTACGKSVDRSDLPEEPLAFIRTKASEGILGFEEFRNAVRLENIDDETTQQARRRTTLALLNVKTGEEQSVPDGGLGSIPLDWSADGLRLLIGKVDQVRGTASLHVWNRYTGTWAPVMRDPVGLGASIGSGPIRVAWSSRMRRSDGFTDALFVLTDQDPIKHQLLVQDATHPDVSADGTQVLYVRKAERPGRDGVIMLASLDGSAPRAITRGSYPRFSRDGGWITFLRQRAGVSDVWLMRGDGTARRKITDTSYAEVYPSVSPDGRFVVYASSRGELVETQLYMTRVSDLSEIQLTQSGQNGRPIW